MQHSVYNSGTVMLSPPQWFKSRHALQVGVPYHSRVMLQHSVHAAPLAVLLSCSPPPLTELWQMQQQHQQQKEHAPAGQGNSKPQAVPDKVHSAACAARPHVCAARCKGCNSATQPESCVLAGNRHTERFSNQHHAAACSQLHQTKNICGRVSPAHPGAAPHVPTMQAPLVDQPCIPCPAQHTATAILYCMFGPQSNNTASFAQATPIRVHMQKRPASLIPPPPATGRPVRLPPAC